MYEHAGGLARRAFFAVAVVLMGVAAVVAGADAPALADPASPTTASDVIQSQDTNKGDIVAELTACNRKDGVLTVKIRFRNTGTDSVNLYFRPGGNLDTWYVTGASKKYFVLKDTDGTALATADATSGNIDKGGAFIWWAKFPAPPPEVKSVTFYTPLTAPFEDVPVKD